MITVAVFGEIKFLVNRLPRANLEDVLETGEIK